MNEFKKFIKAVGTGPKGNRDLSFDESKLAMEMILSGEVSPDMISAFLIGWRLKPETIEEYKGALEALIQNTKKQKIENSIELGFPFDGKARMPYLFPLIAKYLVPQNINLVVTGDERVPSKEGITTKEIINEIKLPSNVHYFDRKDYLPKLSALSELRNNLGLRTAINTLEKASKVGDSDFASFGVFHRPYVEKYSEIFRDKFKSFLIVQANEGSPEVINKCKIWKVSGTDCQEILIEPEKYGIDSSKFNFEDSKMENTIELLKSASSDAVKLSKLNAAVLLWLRNENVTLNDALNVVDM
jgi:anthranilate phosphoribosyltransferase